MALEPRQILDMESPRLSFELLCSKISEMLSVIRKGTLLNSRTVDKFQGGSRTPRTVSPRPVARKWQELSKADAATEDNKALFGKRCEVRSIWA